MRQTVNSFCVNGNNLFKETGMEQTQESIVLIKKVIADHLAQKQHL
jgi:hypothetical protein